MKITFDREKDLANKRKPRLSLADAANFDWDNAMTWLDTRKNYAEDRTVGLGLIGNQVHVVVFVARGDSRRIISLRKANRREVMRYASEA